MHSNRRVRALAIAVALAAATATLTTGTSAGAAPRIPSTERVTVSATGEQ
ncbi:MAG: hypothetical protein HOQ43_21490, partial [Glycomyces artemisiae]|nr:hypothetical protein [Glycomyces artemisiae]